MFYINHNKIIDEYSQIKFEMEKMCYFLKNPDIINGIQNAKNIIINQFSNNIIFLLNNIFELVNITNDCLVKYQDIYPNFFINAFNILQNIIIQNDNNRKLLEKFFSDFIQLIKLLISLI